MNNRAADQESFRILQLMAELEAGEQLSQREISSRLGIAVGLVNSYLKNFVAKGWVRVKSYPRNRYAYLLTPKGLTEKSRLAVTHLSYFTHLYRDARKGYRALFQSMSAKGAGPIAFCGADEVAEIAYLSLLEFGGRPARVTDTCGVGRKFMGMTVQPLESLLQDNVPVVVTSAKRGEELCSLVLEIGVPAQRVFLPQILETNLREMLLKASPVRQK